MHVKGFSGSNRSQWLQKNPSIVCWDGEMWCSSRAVKVLTLISLPERDKNERFLDWIRGKSQIQILILDDCFKLKVDHIMIKDSSQILLVDGFGMGWQYIFQTQYIELRDVTELLNFCFFDCLGLNLSILNLASGQHPHYSWNDNKNLNTYCIRKWRKFCELLMFLSHSSNSEVIVNSSNYVGFISCNFRHLKHRSVQKLSLIK